MFRSAALALVVTASSAWAQQETLEVMFDLGQYSHPGSWSFSQGCTHNPPTGRMNYVHITVVWLEDMNGNYVTTLHRWGRSYLFDLKAWAQAAGLGIDGVTSATPTSQGLDAGQVFTGFTTGALPISSLPDGTYRVRFESTQCELADGFRTTPNPNPFAGGTPFGPTGTLMWTKGRTSQSNLLIGASTPFNNVRVNYVVPAANAPPGVYAGPDQWRMPSVTPAEATTTLTGRASDPAGAPAVQWTLLSTKPAGLTAMIATPNALTTSVTFPQAGIYTFRLTATDPGMLTSTDDVTVYVNARVLPSAADTFAVSGAATTGHGTLELAGPWTNSAAPTNNTGSRAYLRFDLSAVTAQVTHATLRVHPAEQTPQTRPSPSLYHDVYILTDAQDDWNGPANMSTDWESTLTWNNQPVAQGLASNLMMTQKVATVPHLACEFRHLYANPALFPGEPATLCPARMDIDLNVANVRLHDTNKQWSFFLVSNPVGMNGLILGSDENLVSTDLVVVEFWQSAPNMPPVAVPGTYATVVDRNPPLGTESVTLNASASTDDSGIVTYEWRENGVLLGSTGSPMFTTSLSLGVHTLQLTVIDGGGLSNSATTTVMVEDRYEPNHTRMTAAAVTGTGAGTAYPSLYGSAAAPAGDWYSIDLVAGSTLTVAVTMTGGNLDVMLYDPAGALLASAATTALTETAMTTAGAAGRYFIQVAAVGTAVSPYTMTVSASGALTVTLNPAMALENAGTLLAAGTVRLDAPAAAPVMVMLAADQPMQLSFPNSPVTIPMGMTSATFDVRLVDDPPGVPNMARFVNITASAGGYNPGSAMFEILDNEGATVFVQWEKMSESVSEGSSALVQLRAVLSAPAMGQVTIPFTVSGTATRGADFSTPIMGGTLNITSGTMATYVISVTNDQAMEPDETVVVTMGTPTGATAQGNTTYTLTITDDDGGGAGGGSGGTAGGSGAAGSGTGGSGTGTGGGAGGAEELDGVCGCGQGPAGAFSVLMLLALAVRRRRTP